MLDSRLLFWQYLPIGTGYGATKGAATLFVETDSGEWNNLSRASAIKVEPARNGTGWVVVAFYSGAQPVIGRFDDESSAREWVADRLEEMQR